MVNIAKPFAFAIITTISLKMKKYFFLAPSQTQQSQARHCGRHQTPEREHLRHHSDLQFETLLLVPITCKTLCTIGL